MASPKDRKHTFDMSLPASPPPTPHAWPNGSRGRLIQSALLTSFKSLKQQPFPLMVAQFGDPLVTHRGALQLGAQATDKPSCDLWAKGLWSGTTLSRAGRTGLIGMASLLDIRDAPFIGTYAAQVIIHAPEKLLDELTHAPASECATITMSDNQNEWRVRLERSPVQVRGAGEVDAYRLVAEKGAEPTIWMARLRHGPYVMEVRFADSEVKEQTVAVPVMFQDLLDHSFARLRKKLP
ncbi:hypothetical protein GCM10022248_90430 [Nonomuraea soli]